MRDSGSRRRRVRPWIAAVGLLGVVGAIAVATATSSASASPAQAAKAAQACGQDVSYINSIKDPDGVFKKLPAAIQARYGPWPYSVRATPWSTSKPVKGPWKIGLITFPVGCWRRRGGITPCACGRCRRGRRSPPSTWPPPRSPLRPTASASPPQAETRRSSSGTPPRATNCSRSKATPWWV